jgi:hypothetical protein
MEEKMKTRKLFLVLGLVVILLAGTVLVANAADKIKVTGGSNNTFFYQGWEWIDVNVTIDPETDAAEGKLRYRVYEYADDPKIFYSWEADPICGTLTEVDGVPTISLVFEITEVKNMPADWIGKYAKISISDGGQNASEDMLGIVVWDFYTNQPVSEMPTSCEYEVPVVEYPSQNGNLTIHQ